MLEEVFLNVCQDLNEIKGYLVKVNIIRIFYSQIEKWQILMIIIRVSCQYAVDKICYSECLCWYFLRFRLDYSRG